MIFSTCLVRFSLSVRSPAYNGQHARTRTVYKPTTALTMQSAHVSTHLLLFVGKRCWCGACLWLWNVVDFCVFAVVIVVVVLCFRLLYCRHSQLNLWRYFRIRFPLNACFTRHIRQPYEAHGTMQTALTATTNTNKVQQSVDI